MPVGQRPRLRREALAQRRHSPRRCGRNPHSRRARVEIRLGPHPQHGGARGRGRKRLARRGGEDDEIRRRRPRPRPAHPFRLDRILRLAQPRRVGEMHGHAAEIEPHPHRVAGGAGRGGDDGHLLPRQRVEQGRFARVGRPQDDKFQPGPQPRRRRRGLQRRLHLVAQSADPLKKASRYPLRQILIGKVDQRLLPGDELAQLLPPGGVAPLQPAFQRLLALRLGLGGDEIRHRLRLQQIHPPGLEGATGKLPRLRRPGAQRGQRLAHRRQHRPPAMQGEFRHILAGEAARRGKQHHQRLVQHPSPMAQAAQAGAARRGQAARQAGGDGKGLRPGKAQGDDSAAPPGDRRENRAHAAQRK